MVSNDSKKNNFNFENHEQQTQIPNSSTPEELGSGNEIHSREQEALHRLGERTRADEEKLQRPLTRFEIEDLQKEEALIFAKEKNLWIEDLYSLGNPTNIGGIENTIVYNQEQQTLYKSNNLINHQNNLFSFFEGLEGHNAIFPETKYEFVGFTGIDKGEGKTPYIEPILKQDFIVEADQATQEEIDNHMAAIGFEKVNDHTFKNKEYTVSDLRPRNVLKDANGVVYVIDDIVKKNKPNEVTPTQTNIAHPAPSGENDEHSHFIKVKIGNLVDTASKIKDKVVKEFIRPVTKEEIALIKEKTGIDIDEEFEHTIDNSAINHIITKHGNQQKESLQGQIAISKEDFELLPDIIDNYDTIERGKLNEKGLQSIVYTKTYQDGTTYVVEEVRTGRKELALNTMYKRKKSGGLMPTDKSILPLTSETTPDNSKIQNSSENNPEETVENQVPFSERDEFDNLLSGEAEKRRKDGKYTRDGIQYTREEPKEAPKGNTITVKFADEVEVDAAYALLEAREVQPSHLNGRRNPDFFITEAQPKNRKDSASIQASDKIATNPKLNEAGENSNAYSGAPVVNERGEVIQGNNRAEGLKKHYSNNGTSYKQQLIAGAEKFGFTKEQIEAMKNPVLVRMAKVDDTRAIQLGNYDVKDIETGGARRIDPVATSRRIPSVDKSTLMDILFGSNENITLNEALRDKINPVLNILKKYLNQAQVEGILSKDGQIKPKGIEDLENLFQHFLFENGNVNLADQFESLSAKVKNGIFKSLPKLLSLSSSKSILSELQNAISAVHSFVNSGNTNLNLWLNQPDLFNDSKTPRDLYSELEIEIVDLLVNAKTETAIKTIFTEYNELVTGKEADMFTEKVEGLSKKEAVKKIFNVNIEENGRKSKNEVGDVSQSQNKFGNGNDGRSNQGSEIARGEKPENAGHSKQGEQGEQAEGIATAGAVSTETILDAKLDDDQINAIFKAIDTIENNDLKEPSHEYETNKSAEGEPHSYETAKSDEGIPYLHDAGNDDYTNPNNLQREGSGGRSYGATVRAVWNKTKKLGRTT